MATSFLAPLLRQPDATWQLRNSRSGQLLAKQIEPAFDSETRRRGLLGRTSFDHGHAIVIAPSNAIHTFFMKFPIDVIFLRRDGTVVKTKQAIPAWRIAMASRAYAVIELPAGTLSRGHTMPGDILEFVGR